jgi:polysaccharide chain length determinant protein (PEP-CTERM system associated)
VRHYIEQETASKRSESYDATNFLGEQIAIFKEKVAQTESEVSQYKNEKSAVVNLDSGQLFREINLAQQKLFDLQLRRKQLEEEKSFVKSATDPARQKLRVLQKHLEELRVQYTDNYPEILNVKAQIETLEKETIYQRVPGSPAADTPPDIWKIEAEVKAIKENEASIQNHIAENRRLLSSIPSSKYALEKLEAAKATQKNMQDLLSTRNNQAELSKQMGIQDKGTSYKIVDPAVTPVSPVSPNRRKLLMMSIAVGLGGAAALVFLLDQMDNSVKLVDSLKPLGLPILAVIPFIKSEDEIRAAQTRNFRIYVASGACFSLIVGIFLMEVLGVTLFESVISTSHLPQLFAGFFKS